VQPYRLPDITAPDYGALMAELAQIRAENAAMKKEMEELKASLASSQ
jgi:cell division protein FtsB